MPCAIRALCALVLGAALFAPTQAAASTTGTTATYYHPSLQGLRMANGRPYNRWDPMIAANNWYPLGTLLKVTRQGTDQYIYVRVQDRGSRALTLDLSEAGFAQLGGLGEGRIPIWLEVVTSIEGQGPRAVAEAPDDAAGPDAEAPADTAAAPEPEAPAEDTLGPEAPAPRAVSAPTTEAPREPAPARSAGADAVTAPPASGPADADSTTEADLDEGLEAPTAPAPTEPLPLAGRLRIVGNDAVPGFRPLPI